MSKKYRYDGNHAITLASGERISPGDELAADQVDTKQDGYLIQDGVLVDQTKKETSA